MANYLEHSDKTALNCAHKNNIQDGYEITLKMNHWFTCTNMECIDHVDVWKLNSDAQNKTAYMATKVVKKLKVSASPFTACLWFDAGFKYL